MALETSALPRWAATQARTVVVRLASCTIFWENWGQIPIDLLSRKALQHKMASSPKKTAFDKAPVGQFASIKIA